MFNYSLNFSTKSSLTVLDTFHVSYGAVSFLSIWNNALLCIVMLRKRKMMKIPYNILIFGLALTDLARGVIMFLTPGYVVDEASFSIPCGLGGEIFCRLFASRLLIFVLGKSSVLNVMCLSIERWFAVVKPIQYKTRFSKTRVYLYVAVIWITAFVFQSCKLLQVHSSGCACVFVKGSVNASLLRILILSHSIATVFLPTLIMWIAFAHIWYSIRRSPGMLNTRRGRAKKRLLVMCAATAFALTVNWYPTEITYLYRRFKSVDNTYSYGVDILEVVAMSNSMINPVVYCLTNSEYRREFCTLFCSICRLKIKPRFYISKSTYEISESMQRNQVFYLENYSVTGKKSDMYNFSFGT